MFNAADFLFSLLYLAPAALIAITLHEAAHGMVSYWLGDPTPMAQGRLSLNPLHHLDLWGTICLIFMGFGWAKPVRVDPRYYKKPKSGMALVALAGPVMNLIIAFVFSFLLAAAAKFFNRDNLFLNYLVNLLQYTVLLNIGLGVFNLIPLPPLDGSKLLAGILPDKAFVWLLTHEKYFAIVLCVLLICGVLDKPLGILQNALYKVICYPAFLIFGLV